MNDFFTVPAEAVFYNHYKDLKENINKYTKLEAIKH